jgi:hypothetical protein
MHKRLWIDRHGDQMEEFTLRSRIKTYTKAHFGVAIWPHLFRDGLLTTIAVEQPEMIKEGSILLGHASFATGEKYYNQTGMMEASRNIPVQFSNYELRSLTNSWREKMRRIINRVGPKQNGRSRPDGAGNGPAAFCGSDANSGH